MLGLSIGATFVARSFSGDKEQLVPILKAAFAHRGLALIDVISPCVTFNDHEGSTKSYRYTREHMVKTTEADFVPPAAEILANISQQDVTAVTLHDGSVLRLRSVPADYDPMDRRAAMSYLLEQQNRGEIVTGLLFLDESVAELHEVNKTAKTPMAQLAFEKLCPGSAELARFQEDFR
jgi:2-oxoglutarate ferredoxin oxidoreductase subunit beta